MTPDLRTICRVAWHQPLDPQDENSRLLLSTVWMVQGGCQGACAEAAEREGSETAGAALAGWGDHSHGGVCAVHRAVHHLWV